MSIRHMTDSTRDSVSTMTNSNHTDLSVLTHIINPSTTADEDFTTVSTPTHITQGDTSVITLPTSTHNSSCNISDALDKAENSLYLDDFRLKHDGDFRLILQNPRDIKEFRDEDPEYLPTMLAFKEGQCDLLCFVETNVAWHNNDFSYDGSVVNKNIWNTPTKKLLHHADLKNMDLTTTSQAVYSILWPII